MLSLSGSELLGTGRERACYVHPEDESLCIKVDLGVSTRGRRPQSPQDASYLTHLARRGVPFDHLTRYHGKVETDKGLGYVFDRCINRDGTMPRSLRELRQLDAENWPKALLADLFDFMVEYGVVPSDVSPDNVLFPELESGRIAVLIDGVGNRDFIPLATYCRPYARKKIRRKWERFLTSELGMTSAELRAAAGRPAQRPESD
ncbi:MAG: YrbL family protein [Planctomycetota bacterium]